MLLKAAPKPIEQNRQVLFAVAALITRQVATLASSGTPIEEALGAVARQSEKQKIKSLMLSVRGRVLEGRTLANALGEYPKVFPEIFQATVAAGEQSGHLDSVLERLADYTEDKQSTKQIISKALYYPIGLVFIAIAIVTFFVLIVSIVLFVTWRKLLQNEAFKTRVHAFLLKVPLLSKIIRGSNASQFARTLSILAASGVPVQWCTGT